jgi:hypothetical protein
MQTQKVRKTTKLKLVERVGDVMSRRISGIFQTIRKL